MISNHRIILEDYMSLLIERHILENPQRFEAMLTEIHNIASARRIVGSDEIVMGVVGELLYSQLTNVISNFPQVFPFLRSPYDIDYYLLELIHKTHGKIMTDFIEHTKPPIVLPS